MKQLTMFGMSCTWIYKDGKRGEAEKKRACSIMLEGTGKQLKRVTAGSKRSTQGMSASHHDVNRAGDILSMTSYVATPWTIADEEDSSMCDNFILCTTWSLFVYSNYKVMFTWGSFGIVRHNLITSWMLRLAPDVEHKWSSVIVWQAGLVVSLVGLCGSEDVPMYVYE